MQAFQRFRFKALTNNEFGAAAADVDHQAVTGIVGQRVGYAQIDQAGLFTTGNHFNGIAQYRLSTVNKFLPVTRRPQGVGGQHADLGRVHALQTLGKLAQALQTTLLGFFRQLELIVQTRGQLHFLTPSFQRPELAVKLTGHHHMKTVGTQIYRGNQLARLGRCIRHNSLS